jgi:uncharacterized membrane protein
VRRCAPGEGPYKGLFALSLVGALVLMVVGWRSAAPVALYVAPTTGGLLTSAAMFVSLVLFLGSSVPTNLKRFVRHPQLTGVAVWALAHLLANGDVRSLVLFGGLGLWAVVAMVCINRRDGAARCRDRRVRLVCLPAPLHFGCFGSTDQVTRTRSKASRRPARASAGFVR